MNRKFRKSRTAKVISGFVGLTTGLLMVGGGALTASAQTVSDLQTQIAALLAQITALQTQLNTVQGGTTTTVSGYTFTRNLKKGDTGEDVLELQKVLNADPDTQVAVSGVGSAGNETNYFGGLTKAAVIKFQNKYADDVLTPVGLTAGTGYVGPSTRAKLNSMGQTTTVVTPPTTGGTTGVVVGTDLSVTLSSDSPASGAVIQGQAIAGLANFAFTNNTSTDAKVTKVVLNRTGISNDSVLANVYLFDGGTRTADSATVSSGVITFNDPSGIFTVPAGGTVVISVKADIAGSTAGQIVGVQLTSVESTEAVVGTFPIAGNVQTVASATLAGVAFQTTITPAAASIDAQDDYVMFQENVSITTRAVNLESLTFRQIGSVNAGDLQNFELYINSVKVGDTVASLDSNGYVTFDLRANPVKLETGTRTIKVVGDIVGGSTRTFSFSLRQSADAMFVDSELGQPVLVTGNSSSATGSFAARTSGTQTINAGTLTITKKTDSPSGNINPDASNVVLATFELKASGEPIKVESLTVQADVSTASVGNLRNGALFANGIQVGSTQNITDSTSGTQFNLGSALTVQPGSPVTLEVRADIYDNDGTNTTISAGDTITAKIVVGSSNLQRTNALTYFANSAVSGNTRTVAVGAVSGSKYSAYGDQTIVVPQTAYKIGDFRVTANSAEGVNLNTITLALGGDATVTDITDLYIKYNGKTSSTKATGASSQTWNISEALSAGNTMSFEVYGTLSSSIASASTTVATLTVAGTSDSSASVTTTAITGQTITAATGSIAAAALSDSSVATKLLVGGTTGVKVASFRITAVNQAYKVTDIALKVTNAKSSGAIVNTVLKSGGVTLGTIGSYDSNLTATSTGLALNIPSNDSAGTLVDVYLDLNTVSAGTATSTANVLVTLEGFKYQPANGGTEAEYATDKSGSAMYVVKSKPTVSMVAQSDSTLSAGTGKVLAKVKIDADSANQIGWKKLVFTISKTSSVTVGATSTLQIVDSNNNEITGTFATTTGSLLGGLDALGSATSGTVSFVADTEQQISTAETYSLKGTIGGIASGYNYLSVSIAAPSTSIATPNTYTTIAGSDGTQTPSLVWTDRSSNSHSESTADWINDYKVKDLPTDSTTLSVTI